MDAFPRREVRDLLLLSLTAGSADAAGYMGLGRVFTSNMTGNVVLMGIDLGQGRIVEAVHSAFVLLIFMFGVFLGLWMNRRIDEKEWSRLLLRATSVEAVLLAIFAVLWCLRPESTPGSAYYLVTFLALAMGIQSSAFNRLKIPGVATTAITSTLTSLTAGAVRAISHLSSPSGGERPSRTSIVFQCLFLGLYLGGAALSGVVIIFIPRFIGFFPAAFVLFVVLSETRARTR
jgi:uncharacterized membrane protein YoaK (UPF0700 family)